MTRLTMGGIAAVAFSVGLLAGVSGSGWLTAADRGPVGAADFGAAHMGAAHMAAARMPAGGAAGIGALMMSGGMMHGAGMHGGMLMDMDDMHDDADMPMAPSGWVMPRHAAHHQTPEAGQ